jgi:hypothetical protein
MTSFVCSLPLCLLEGYEGFVSSHLAEVVFAAFRGLVNSLYRAMPQTRILAIALEDNDPPV